VHVLLVTSLEISEESWLRVDGGPYPRSPERCPRSIGIVVRNRSESLSALAGIRISFPGGSGKRDCESEIGAPDERMSADKFRSYA
jgi:hypothetical protein